jgi:hypothetical protein
MNDNITNIIVENKNTESNTFLEKLKVSFSTEEQQIFINNFYMYLNYDKEKDYIINLDNVWKWLGFARLDHCKRVLVKYFVKDVDYKIENIVEQSAQEQTASEVVGALNSVNETAPPTGGALKVRGCAGSNKEKITMNINTFKKLCLKASTKKADTIHDYYIKMEEVVNEYLKETFIFEKKILKEKTLIESYDKKTVNYFGTIGEELGKFGSTRDIDRRVKEHKKDIGTDFILEYVIETDNHQDLEQKFKEHNDIKNRRISKTINGKIQTELLRLDEYLRPVDIKKIIKNIKNSISIDKEIRVMNHKERMLELENIKMKELTKQKEIELEMCKLSVFQNPKVEKINDSTSIINFSNSYSMTPMDLKVMLSNKKWRVDFSYTFSGNTSIK